MGKKNPNLFNSNHRNRNSKTAMPHRFSVKLLNASRSTMFVSLCVWTLWSSVDMNDVNFRRATTLLPCLSPDTWALWPGTRYGSVNPVPTCEGWQSFWFLFSKHETDIFIKRQTPPKVEKKKKRKKKVGNNVTQDSYRLHGVKTQIRPFQRRVDSQTKNLATFKRTYRHTYLYDTCCFCTRTITVC